MDSQVNVMQLEYLAFRQKTAIALSIGDDILKLGSHFCFLCRDQSNLIASGDKKPCLCLKCANVPPAGPSVVWLLVGYQLTENDMKKELEKYQEWRLNFEEALVKCTHCQSEIVPFKKAEVLQSVYLLRGIANLHKHEDRQPLCRTCGISYLDWKVSLSKAFLHKEIVIVIPFHHWLFPRQLIDLVMMY